MITFNAYKRAMTSALTGAALAMGLLVGVAQVAPAGAAQLHPPGPSAAPPVACGIIVQGADGCDPVQASIIQDGIIVHDGIIIQDGVSIGGTEGNGQPHR